jgi:hypothetical protein
MSKRSCHAWRAALYFHLCILASGAIASTALAQSPYKVLNHEAIRIEAKAAGNGRQHLSLSAFGKQFELSLQPNEGIRRAVPVNRSDIQPMQGTLDGQPGSWVRITHTRSGWRGMVFDGQELYAIEPVSDVAEALVQPHAASGSDPVMYRLADALMTVGTGFCATAGADGAADASTPDKPSALKVFKAIAADLGAQAQASQFPSRRLMTGIVADTEFATAFDDAQGAIIARMDIVDGIFSSQVGVKISLAPITLITTPTEPFTTTVPNDLLNQVRQYRSSHASQMSLGVTHLMTGRNLDGNIVGISYQGAICKGSTSAGLSEAWHSTTMSALIAAHELGHNFNAPHDGVPGACASTPQTFLMAPQINGSNQFSSCSLQQMQARIQTAQCLTQYDPPDVSVSLPSNSVGAAVNSPFTLSYTVRASGDDASDNVSATVELPANMTVQSATTSGTSCTQGTGTVSCSLGTLQPGDTREIDLELTAAAAGTSTLTLGVGSSNDSDTSNDSGTVTANISEAANVTPPTPPAEPATSGGGGGGRLDVTLLAFLGLIYAITCVRKRRSVGMRSAWMRSRDAQPARGRPWYQVQRAESAAGDFLQSD